MDFYKKAINSLRWQEVTYWYRWNNGLLQFNHIEDGHCPNDIPTARNKEQQSNWKGGKWSKRLSYMTRDYPAVTPEPV